MTYRKFAQEVLGLQLLNYQIDILNDMDRLSIEGEDFHINMPINQDDTALIRTIIQQKLGYDKGLEDGKKKAENKMIFLNDWQSYTCWFSKEEFDRALHYQGNNVVMLETGVMYEGDLHVADIYFKTKRDVIRFKKFVKAKS